MINITTSNDKVKSLELYLGKGVFATGQHLSGVVLINLETPINIRSIVISMNGVEEPNNKHLPEVKKTTFFHRDIVLTGSSQPKSSIESASKIYKEVLGRECGKTLNTGEHIYPFFISLPSSIPPSYSGWAGTIKYPLSVTINLLYGKTITVETDAEIVHTPKKAKHIPISTGYPKSEGNILPNSMKVAIEIAQQAVEIGGVIEGNIHIQNPDSVECRSITVYLDLFEVVKGNSKQDINSSTIEQTTIDIKNPKDEEIVSNFILKVPEDAHPTVESTSISVVWLLKVSVDSEFPQDIKMPINVYSSIKEKE